MARTRAKLALVAVGVAAAIGVAVPVALAAVGDGGVVTVCVKGESWRPIDNGATCKQNEQQLRLLGADGKAVDSDELDGIDSTGFLGATAKAADSDKLDGIDSGGFVQGQGTRTFLSYDLVAGGSGSAVVRDTAAGRITIGCMTSDNEFVPNGYAWGFTPIHGGAVAPWKYWRDDNGVVTYTQFMGGPFVSAVVEFRDGGTRHVVIRVSSPDGFAGTWDVFLQRDSGGCRVSLQEEIAPLTAGS